MRCVALFPLGNMQHFQEGFNRLSQTLFWTRVMLCGKLVVMIFLVLLAAGTRPTPSIVDAPPTGKILYEHCMLMSP